MPTIGKRLGVVLGPRGKMPRPVPPGSDPSNLVNALKRSIRVRLEEQPDVPRRRRHRGRCRRRSSPRTSTRCSQRIIGKLERGRTNIESVYVKTTMGPAVRVW